MRVPDIIAAGHAETARLDVREMVRRLNGNLGTLLVATLTGSKDSKLPYKWAKPDGAVPGPAFQKRL
ncbi:hypothetical protein [Arthrobacter sp. CAN_C5]|uniref:hypothetical protein n=1 Tax=Arthrobacter sp. CAN_C5 TaxID=2760706 RepID=UPI001FD90D6F|nr:hypothetical protein [Arthrobacter sp. CAN_C5]MBP2216013.1 hypothetical protein [Arthrobacter sp. CAN_C5]